MKELKTLVPQGFSYIGSHSSHVATGILFIWEKFKIVLPDTEYFLYMFMCVREIVATMATLCCFLDRWFIIVTAEIYRYEGELIAKSPVPGACRA